MNDTSTLDRSWQMFNRKVILLPTPTRSSLPFPFALASRDSVPAFNHRIKIRGTQSTSEHPSHLASMVTFYSSGYFLNTFQTFSKKSCERWRTEILAEDGRSWTRQTQKTKTQQSFRYLGYWPPNSFPTSSFEFFLWGVFCCWVIHLVFVFLIHAIFSSCRSYQPELCNTVIRNKVTHIAKIKGKSTKTT